MYIPFTSIFLIISQSLITWGIFKTFSSESFTKAAGIVILCTMLCVFFVLQMSRYVQQVESDTLIPTPIKLFEPSLGFASTPSPTNAEEATGAADLATNAMPTPLAGDIYKIVVPNTQIEISFVYVPEGQFTMGSNQQQIDEAYRDCSLGMSNCQHIWFEIEAEPHEVDVAAFWIMQTEVTNAQFQPFVKDRGYEKDIYWTPEGIVWRNTNRVVTPDCWGEEKLNADNQPSLCVSWWEAKAYAKWLSNYTRLEIRLPTEAEWEKSARGTDGRIYPWGDRWDSNNANKAGSSDGFPYTAPVGSFQNGRSPYNALDMSGNVWEWTSTIYQPYPYNKDDGREIENSNEPRSVRGGSWANTVDSVRTTARGRNYPQIRDIHLGFRLAWASE